MMTVFAVMVHFISLSMIVGSAIGQCKLIDSSKDALFITFDRQAMVKVDGVEKLQKGIILRLHNNTSCTVRVTSGDPILKPLPANPTTMQRIKGEIEFDIPDNGTVPFVQYRYETKKESGYSVGGDNYYQYSLFGNRSMLFEVPFLHLDARYITHLDLPFSYEWEKGGQVNNLVRFWIGELPEEIQKDINRSKR